jgi:hypothetical protein
LATKFTSGTVAVCLNCLNSARVHDQCRRDSCLQDNSCVEAVDCRCSSPVMQVSHELHGFDQLF